MQQKISIIVPIYNCEKFLSRCLESIRKQTYTNLEIILVDDGSTDSSSTICNRYSNIDERIKVIHQQNMGQIGARLTGLKAATGEYVGFIDADDYIDEDMYEYLYSQIGNADLITSGMLKCDAMGNVLTKWIDIYPEGLYESKQDMDYVFQNLILAENYDGGSIIGGTGNHNVTKLFKTKLAQSIIPQVNINIRIEEDQMFNLLYLLKCNSIKVTHKCFYHYIDNENSVCHTYYSHYLQEREVFYETIISALKGHPYEKTLTEQFKRRFFAETIGGISSRMLFSNKVFFPVFYPPFMQKLFNKKIALFGAGKVGTSYAKWITIQKIGKIVIWVDNNPLDAIQCKPQQLIETDFDFVVIAIKEESIAKEIKAQIINLGIRDEYILWEQPENILQALLLQNSIAICRGGVRKYSIVFYHRASVASFKEAA